MLRLPAICLLVMLACSAAAHAADDYDGWWPDPYEVADEQQQAERSQRSDELTPEQRRALHEYLAKHADRDGDGDFDADDIQQFERTGELSMLRDGDLMGGYFGSGDEFIRDGVEHEVNGGRYLRDSMNHEQRRDRDRAGDGERVAKLDLFGMRGFLSDEGTYSNPNEDAATSQFIHWRLQVAQLLPGYIPPADYTELLQKIESQELDAVKPKDEPKRQPRQDDNDPTVWW
ncbi:hypothetical protein KDL29_01440 [bacterium]|nr:hypothetical protein [bacterium]